ncbi:MAG: acetate--CoA ligase family protein [Rubrobacter sp.]|nr:acetate--CoA ligase family protein [Rubrobacter sp.]
MDILGDADPERYAKTLELVREDPGSDGMLVVLTLQAMSYPTATAEALAPYAKTAGERALASWMEDSVALGDEILDQAGIPTFSYPDTAARVFDHMRHYTHNLRSIYETPELAEEDCFDPERAGEIVEAACDDGRILLTEPEVKELLSAYGIPTVETKVARNPEEAIGYADAMGYPVVLKLYSESITHKTDVGGVQLNLW